MGLFGIPNLNEYIVLGTPFNQEFCREGVTIRIECVVLYNLAEVFDCMDAALQKVRL